MKKITITILAAALLVAGYFAFTGAGTSAAAPNARVVTADKLAHNVKNDDAPVVLFTKDLSPDGLLRIYEALGRKPQGKVAIKLTFEAPGDPHLDPKMLKKLRDKVNGTFVDCNGFTPPRNSTAGHLEVAKQHGFTAVGPVDILDSEGTLDMPVKNGKHLKYHRTGSHFANYGSVISIVHFKPHHIQVYGGTMKNLTICLGSISGKGIIHSAGANENGYSEASERDDFLESMADAVKAALDYRKDRWVFINVLNNFEPDDGCEDAPHLKDIGIIASLDPVALDQAAIDFTYGAAPSAATRRHWEEIHDAKVLGFAESAGCGKRNYRLVSID